MGLRKIGAGCPIGPAMPPGRGLGLGGACASAFAPSLQRVLPIRRQSHRGRRYFAGGFLACVPNARELSFGAWGLCDVDDQRHTKPVDRPLPSNQKGPRDIFSRRFHGGGREQGIGGAAAGRASAARRTERAGAVSADPALARVTRSCDFARPAAVGVCGNSAGARSARGNGEVTHQPRAYRACAYIATNGCEAVMKLRTNARNLVFVEATVALPVGVES
jgi:hypothetical protein